ncbi:heme exporter protein CcmD [Roseitranquillus sediminis]|nr:heme exporter protein CcmD [Roseitranquillus sediminis]MBM9594927.1 heme exporter protein CcmD [Roseitranquillus sediminis]
MPDLGKYAAEILTAYGASAILLGGIVWASVARAARLRRRLDELEGRGRG